MIDEAEKQRFKEWLEKEIYLCHDPEYCYNCGRSIVAPGVTIEKEADDMRYIWEFCQVEHVIDDPEIPDEPFNVITPS